MGRNGWQVFARSSSKNFFFLLIKQFGKNWSIVIPDDDNIEHDI
jgi:hypothetical protein